MSLLELLIAAKIGTDPQFLGSIWTQIWTGLDSNPVFGFYGVEIFMKYAGISFTYYVIILGVKSHDDLDDAGGGIDFYWGQV